MAEFQQILVKLAPDVQVPYEDGIEVQLRDLIGPGWDTLAAMVPFEISLLRLYDNDEVFALVEAARQAGGDQASELLRWFRLPFPEGADAEDAATLLARLPVVEQAFVETHAVLAMATSTEPLRTTQAWQDDAQTGIGVDAARDQPGGMGAGVNYVDVEYGWRLDHEDLIDLGLTVEFGQNNAVLNFSTGPLDVRLHGTPVVAITAATETGVGGVGIAPHVNVHLVSAFDSAVGGFNHHSAITTAIGRAGSGGILLVELQDPSLGPLEMNAAHQAELFTATSLGVTVIEPAGNGTVAIDNFADFFGRHVLDRNSPDFFESGAVMVGSATSTAPRSRLASSSFGSRIDCYAWGENIECASGSGTTTHGAFSGTSGASAIIAGVAASIQGMALAKRGQFLTPAEVRNLLLIGSDIDDGAPSPTVIGTMPDLAQIATLI
jgi:serine protease